MRLQFNNKAISSFMLTIDHAILKSGDAYTNASSLFYPVTGGVYGLNAYATPYRQLVHDVAVTGAIVPSGLFVNGQFLQPGQSGLVSFNIQEGVAYFSTKPTGVSGTFAVKEINVYLVNDPEEKLLFETKYDIKPKSSQTPTGLSPTNETFPVVFVKPMDSYNEPFCLGGTDNKIMRVRAVVLAESLFQCNAVCSILESLANKKHPLINVTGLPFDAIGGYTGISYSYENASSGTMNYIFVKSAKSSQLMSARELNNLNPAVIPAFVDFELWNFIGP